MASEPRQVASPLPQSGQRDDGDVEAVVKIRSKTAGLHIALEVARGRRHDPNVEVAGTVLADPPDLALLQRPEQLGLERRRQISDLVEEDGAALGLLEQALAVPVGPGKRAAGVPEELALQEGGRDGRHVDRHEGARGPLRQRVDGPRHGLLPASGLPPHEHRDGSGSETDQTPVRFLHGNVRGHDSQARPALREVGARRRNGKTEEESLQQPGDGGCLLFGERRRQSELVSSRSGVEPAPRSLPGDLAEAQDLECVRASHREARKTEGGERSRALVARERTRGGLPKPSQAVRAEPMPAG